MNEREYRKLKNGIDRRYSDDIAALERVWRIANQTEPPAEERTRLAKGVSEDAVVKAGEAMEGEFTTKHIEDWIASNMKSIAVNRTTISHKIKGLVQDSKLNVIREGKGKRAGVFEKAIQDAANRSVDEIASYQESQSDTVVAFKADKMASEGKIKHLKDVLQRAGVSAAEFKKEYLVEICGVSKMAELTEEQIDMLIETHEHDLEDV